MDTKKLLIVEDELTLLTILKDKFISEGINVFATQSGEKAYEIALEEKPDLILTDLIMYPIDGIALIKKLRASGNYGAEVKCIILSNERIDDLKVNIDELNIEKYINKADMPINLLVNNIKEFLK
jgi:DNA-binding response OmpR family regulator